jgi:hypothetical protein
MLGDRDLNGLVAGAGDLEEYLVLPLEQDFLIVAIDVA